MKQFYASIFSLVLAAGLLPGMSLPAAATGPSKAGAPLPGNTAASEKAGEPAGGLAAGVQADTAITYPSRRPSRQGWETALIIPSKIIQLPFVIVFKTTELSIEYIDDTRIVSRTIDLLTADDYSWKIRPIFESRIGPGIKFSLTDQFNKGSRLSVTACAGKNWRQHYGVELKRLKLFGSAVTTGMRVNYRRQSDQEFYGIGPATREADELAFTHEIVLVEANAFSNLSRRMALGVAAGWSHNNILDGVTDKIPSIRTVFSDQSLPGLESGLRMFTSGLVLRYDSKDRPGNPSAGWEVMASGRLQRQVDGEQFGFYKLRTELTRYLHLFYERVLVASVTAQMTEPLDGRAVPFFYLSEVGRKENIRGYHHGRFRDRDLLYGTVEYRYPIWRTMDAALFFDAGKVTPDISNGLPDGDLQYAYGLSLRLWNPWALIAKLDIGKSREQVFVYFNLD